jgi:tetratricopeptide (TPR) repeat protein
VKRRPSLGPLVALAIAAAAALGIARLQPELAADVHKVKQRDDVFLLPPPAELRAMTLGYRAATTDLLWAKLVYEYGLHWQERRAFPDVTRYFDGILALEPDFPTLYAFVDTIMVFNATPGTEEDARTARRYLERGTRERPYDPEVWLRYGQFVAFLAPSFLKDDRDIEAWRKDGALALARAVELGADADRSLSATTILSAAGERKAAIDHLQRAYAMTDDPETRRQILYKLQRLQASQDSEQAVSVVEREWRSRWLFLSRGTTLLLGPARDPAACAGPASYDRPGCARDWSGFVERAR